MLRTYTEAEMIDLWREVNGLSPTRADSRVERTDGLNINAIILRHVNSWYESQLQSAAAKSLPVADLKDRAAITMLPHGVAEVTLPDECVRPLSVRLEGWKQKAKIMLDFNDTEAFLQRYFLTQGGPEQPVAFYNTAGEADKLFLHSTPLADPRLLELRCVVRPEPGTYRFDPSLITSIPVINV